MNYQALNSVLKEKKKELIYNSIIFTSIVFTGVGLFSKLGKAGFALGITGFIPLAAFSLLATAAAVHGASNEIKEDHKISKREVKYITTVAIPFILGTVLIGIGLFGNKLDSNIKFIAGIVGFAALSFFTLYIVIDNVKNIKQEYESELKNASYKNGVEDQELHAI